MNKTMEKELIKIKDNLQLQLEEVYSAIELLCDEVEDVHNEVHFEHYKIYLYQQTNLLNTRAIQNIVGMAYEIENLKESIKSSEKLCVWHNKEKHNMERKYETLIELTEETIDLLRGWGTSHIPDKQQERINCLLYEIRKLKGE